MFFAHIPGAERVLRAAEGVFGTEKQNASRPQALKRDRFERLGGTSELVPFPFGN